MDGKFDGKHNITILIYKDQNEQKNRGEIFSFSPDNSAISEISVESQNSLLGVGKDLEVPIDGKINVTKLSDFKDPIKIESTLGSIILNYKDVKTNLTLIDLFRLWYFSRSIPKNSIMTDTIVLTAEINQGDYVVSDYFVDYAMLKEKGTIQIINGTGVSGLGNKLAKLITNIGGNVVSVSTSDNLLDSSEIIYYGDSTYTSSRLAKILKFKTVQTKNPGISDITISLGKDSENSDKF